MAKLSVELNRNELSSIVSSMNYTKNRVLLVSWTEEDEATLQKMKELHEVAIKFQPRLK